MAGRPKKISGKSPKVTTVKSKKAKASPVVEVDSDLEIETDDLDEVEEADEVEADVIEDSNDESDNEDEDSESAIKPSKTRGKSSKSEVVPYVDKDAVPYSDKYFELLEKGLRANEKKLSIMSSSKTTNAKLSTGSLAIDFMMGGGIQAGMFTFAGQEQSSKSTTLLHILSSAYENRIPLIMLNDAEGSVQRAPEYAENIFGVNSMTEVFASGGRSGKENRGKIRYYFETGLEKVLTMINKTLMMLPDQIYRPDTDTWYRVFKDDPQSEQVMRALGGEFDKQLLKDTNRYWCPIPNCPPLQCLIGVDSYPSLIPAELDAKEEDDKSGMALSARKFSEYLPKVVGKLNVKAAALVGVNQIREKPMVMYGCFHGDTEVALANGNFLNISTIVENAMDVEVLSFNRETAGIEHKRVVNWFKNGYSTVDEFVYLTLVPKFDASSPITLTVTKGHKILTHRGMISVGDMAPNDVVLGCINFETRESVDIPRGKYQYDIEEYTIKSIVDAGLIDYIKYDIEVEDNHTYFVSDRKSRHEDLVIVSNSPEYEPGGSTLKFRSDFRAKADSKYVPKEWPKGKDPETNNPTAMYTEDRSWTDPNAMDRYAFKLMTNTKNKFGTPYVKVMTRIWIKDADGNGRGIDPVFDCYHYLQITGQLIGDHRKKFRVKLDCVKNVEFDWHKFKGLILSELYPEILPIFKKEYGASNPPKLRKICAEQIAEGKSIDMYNAYINAAKQSNRGKKKSVDLGLGDDDDDDDTENL